MTKFGSYTSETGATFSDDGVYRYDLWRVWDSSLPLFGTVGENPSTANAEESDPTITRVITRAHDNGFGGLVMTNAYPFKATKQRVMWDAQRRDIDIVTPEGDAVLRRLPKSCPVIMLAWGASVPKFRADAVIRLLREGGNSRLVHLGLCDNGNPKHPLYIERAQPLLPWGS